jgi:hypothetical protein
MAASRREASARAGEIFAGRSCFRQGLSLSDCPHKEGTQLSDWWRQGWGLESELARMARGPAPIGS